MNSSLPGPVAQLIADPDPGGREFDPGPAPYFCVD